MFLPLTYTCACGGALLFLLHVISKSLYGYFGGQIRFRMDKELGVRGECGVKEWVRRGLAKRGWFVVDIHG